MEQKNGLSTAGVVLGVVGFILSWIPFIGITIGWILGILAIIFGSVGITRANRMGGLGKSAAVAGLVLGIVTIVFKSIPVVNLL